MVGSIEGPCSLKYKKAIRKKLEKRRILTRIGSARNLLMQNPVVSHTAILLT